jgi:hypothetical protein
MDPDDLYCLPLDEFVPERAALAKALRAEGRRDEAAEVAKLPKPSVAAWAVNQVVRAQPQQAAALWEAGDAVLETQERVFAGEAAGPELREAIERQRAALEPLAAAARGLVAGGEKFLGEAHVQAVVETLHAAAVDPGAREDVAAARVARPLRLTGLEAIPAGPGARRPAEPSDDVAPSGGAKTPRAGGAEAGGAKRRAGGDRESDAARARIAERERRDKEAEAERRAAEKAYTARVREAERAVARAERDRDAARSRVQKAVAARDEAAVRVERAEAALLRAEGVRADAHAELEQAEDAVDRARAELDDAR